tara:strand:+ start:5073 stop:5369 length:297 start_codon:yes stop_codon:yes gene_type:complete
MKFDKQTLIAFKEKLEKYKAQDNYGWETPMNTMIEWTEDKLEESVGETDYKELVNSVLRKMRTTETGTLFLTDEVLIEIMKELDWNQVAINNQLEVDS